MQVFMRLWRRACLPVAAAVLAWGVGAWSPAAALAPVSPAFGPNVYVFTPSMAVSDIQATIAAITTQQLTNQFGTQRYALLFAPGTYGSASTPLNVQVGYYTQVAGLGQSPGDVVINGSINVYNQCDSSGCIALNNFWRSLSNLTLNVTNAANAGCYSGEFWAVSQASPMRRMAIVNAGNTTLMDYCTGPSYASGGFIADTSISGAGLVINGSQQQFFVRNSVIPNWSNGVWNQVFSGVTGAPATCFPAAACGGPYTTLPTSPITREAPFLYMDGTGGYDVFVPAVQTNSSGITWGSGPTPGKSLPLSQFFIATPSTRLGAINAALASGHNLLLTPGVYSLPHPIEIGNPDTVVVGLGFPTLVPASGSSAVTVANVKGVLLSGLIVDAGPVTSSVLVSFGGKGPGSFDPADPSGLYDVFFRIGGATAGSARVALEVNSDDVILDDIWAWRADHGAGVGWTSNTANSGLVVNGNNVTAYGLAVEHFQQYEVIWRGSNGTDIFFQNEMPYDPPSQAAWMESPRIDGWAAFKVMPSASNFTGYGMGSYTNFTAGPAIYAESAFEVPNSLPPGSLKNIFTIFLNTTSFGGILNVVNRTGGPAIVTDPDAVVPVVSYP